VAYAITQDDKAIIRGQSRDSDATNLIIPETIDDKLVTAIQSYAFKDDKYSERIYIPESVEIIGERVFEGMDEDALIRYL